MKRESSVASGNGWYILIRALDHLWADYDARQLLWLLSLQAAREQEIIIPGSLIEKMQ